MYRCTVPGPQPLQTDCNVLEVDSIGLNANAIQGAHFQKNKSNKSQEQAKQRANFLALNVISCCISNWGGRKRICRTDKINFARGWKFFWKGGG